MLFPRAFFFPFSSLLHATDSFCFVLPRPVHCTCSSPPASGLGGPRDFLSRVPSNVSRESQNRNAVGNFPPPPSPNSPCSLPRAEGIAASGRGRAWCDVGLSHDRSHVHITCAEVLAGQRCMKKDGPYLRAHGITLASAFRPRSARPSRSLQAAWHYYHLLALTSHLHPRPTPTTATRPSYRRPSGPRQRPKAQHWAAFLARPGFPGSMASLFSPPTHSNLEDLPVEVLAAIAYYVAVLPSSSAPHKGPASPICPEPGDGMSAEVPHVPALVPAPAPALAALLCASPRIHHKIGLASCPQLYARMFQAKFDTSALERRFGPAALTASVLAAELVKRCKALHLMRSVVATCEQQNLDGESSNTAIFSPSSFPTVYLDEALSCEPSCREQAAAPVLQRPHHDRNIPQERTLDLDNKSHATQSVVEDTLWLAYLMMTENDGKNCRQLVWACAAQFCNIAFHLSSSIGSSVLPNRTPMSIRSLAFQLVRLMSLHEGHGDNCAADIWSFLQSELPFEPHAFAAHKVRPPLHHHDTLSLVIFFCPGTRLQHAGQFALRAKQ